MPRSIYWAIASLIVALLSAGMGFGGLASSGEAYRIIFGIAIVLFAASVAISLLRPD